MYGKNTLLDTRRKSAPNTPRYCNIKTHVEAFLDYIFGETYNEAFLDQPSLKEMEVAGILASLGSTGITTTYFAADNCPLCSFRCPSEGAA